MLRQRDNLHLGEDAYWEDMMRGAIEAVREPTPAMIEAGLSVTATWLSIKGSGLTIAREKMKRRFRAMIDSALAENDTAAK